MRTTPLVDLKQDVHAVGPPATTLGDPGEASPIVTGSTLGLEFDEPPPRVEEERGHVAVKLVESREITEGICARGISGFDNQRRAVAGDLPTQLEALAGTFEGPNVVTH